MAAIQKKTIGAGKADKLSGQTNQMAKTTGNGGLSPGTRNADDGYTPCFAFWKKVIDNGPAHRTRLTTRGLKVHQQTRTGVDLDDCSMLLEQGAGNIFHHQIDAGDIKADDARSQSSQGSIVRVNIVGDVEGVAVRTLDQYFFACRRNGFRGEALTGQFHGNDGIDQNFRKRMQFGRAPARVGIDLTPDEFLHGRFAVSLHIHYVAAGGGGQLTADNEQTVFGARDGALDKYTAAFIHGNGIGHFHFFFGLYVNEDTTTMIAVDGLDTNR